MNYEGHVLYSQDKTKKIPFAVISANYERKAALTAVPKKLKRFLVEIEDRRFHAHNGVDLRGIVRAGLQNIKAGKIVQGGSTITQQLARNLLRDNTRTISRKISEIRKAIELEKVYTKDEILLHYFNNIYFGGNLYGIRAASLYYFGKEPSTLSEIEQLALITILRGPNYYTRRIKETQHRYQKINKVLFDRNIISKNRYEKNNRSKWDFQRNSLEVFDSKTIPFIAEVVHDSKLTIDTTINNRIQRAVSDYVSRSKYPVSIICISRKGVLATASTYGSAHPFISKTNVGSTLKPFLYIHLRQQGIHKQQTFSAITNESDWDVKEATFTKSILTLADALAQSNNNSFINACSYDFESVYRFLSSTLNKEINEFYPSSVLGATKSGISLYELATAYSRMFHKEALLPIEKECLTILQSIALEKLQLNFENVFLKTGTTNGNKERFAILGNADLVFAISRGENPITDYSKEGSFLEGIRAFVTTLFSSSKDNDYKWT
jgi:penicillin-binding protein 1A